MPESFRENEEFGALECYEWNTYGLNVSGSVCDDRGRNWKVESVLWPLKDFYIYLEIINIEDSN